MEKAVIMYPLLLHPMVLIAFLCVVVVIFVIVVVTAAANLYLL